MAYSDQQIKELAIQLAQKGAPEEEIDAFVRAAVEERGQAAPARQTMPRRSIIQTIMAPPVMDMGDAKGRNIDEKLSHMVSGVPATVNSIANLGIRGAPPAIGQAAGASLGPAGVMAGGAIGGFLGEGAAQMREGDFRPGALAGAALAGAVPGSPLANVGVRGVAKEALKQGAGNLAGTVTETAIDEGRLPSLARAGIAAGAGVVGTGLAKGLDKGVKAQAALDELARKSPALENLSQGVKEGFKLTPKALGAALNKEKGVGTVNSMVQSIGGLAETNAQAILHNQEIANKLTRRMLGVPDNVPLRRSEPALGAPGTAEVVRDQYFQPYKELSGIAEQAKRDIEVLDTKTRLAARNEHELHILSSDPKTVRERAELSIKAAADVNELKTIRHKAKEKFDAAMADKGNPELLKEAKSLWAEAEGIEDSIEKAARLVGKPELADQLKVARKKIAQSYIVEAALDHAGNISSPVLGRMLDAGIPLTDELRLIAKFEQTAGGVMRETKTAASTTGGQLRFLTSVLGAAGGTAARDPTMAAALAAAPYVAQFLAKRTMMSGPYQRTMLNPAGQFDAPVADSLAQFARLSTEAAARQPSSFMRFLEKEFPNRERQQPQRPAPYRQ